MLENGKLKPYRGGRAVTLGVSLVLLVSSSFPILAQAPQKRGDAAPRQDFVGVPLSDNIVAGELLLKSGEVVQFYARDGTVVRIENEDYHYAFTSKVEEDGRVHFTMYEISRLPGQPGAVLEMATRIGTGLALSPGDFAIGDMPLAIQVRNVQPADFDSVFFDGSQPMETEVLRNLAEKSGSCCVLACDGTIVCGCSVSTGCSSCCAGSCCGFGGGPFQKQLQPEP